MDMGFPAERRHFFQAPIKLAQPFPAPELRAKNLSDTCAIRYENKGNVCDTPLCENISSGYCAIWGGISHWATKGVVFVTWELFCGPGGLRV